MTLFQEKLWEGHFPRNTQETLQAGSLLASDRPGSRPPTGEQFIVGNTCHSSPRPARLSAATGLPAPRTPRSVVKHSQPPGTAAGLPLPGGPALSPVPSVTATLGPEHGHMQQWGGGAVRSWIVLPQTCHES